jgi:hypothetical protein
VALTQSVHREAHAGEGRGTTIANSRRNAGEILAEWRAAEREAQGAAPDSVAGIEARARADRLREEYREAFDAAKDADR